ncbi:PTR2-domain-containing protein [Cantharellus anzutake]|uniref:PTR2-domain-containing protein n=1 Tax=Cantharellus anzutake TaxID=1750568 RepID=UPI001904D1B1|nr:PTR2-domain-containing protein [Cantharellus anzutake]KAF8314556.1 PTR2-domain-containing protein [Cantharellus anzutake]
MAERFSYYGSTAVFTNFIQQPLPRGSRTGAGGHDHVSGALGRGIQAATGLTTFNQFWVYVIPLFGAYIADTKLGRYKTISWAVFIAMIGHVLLIVSSVPGVIEHSSGALACFTLALIVMGLGTGGFKANISPLVAEQYQVSSMRIKTLSDGTRVIVDPAVTTARIYLYFYLLINVGALVGQLGMTYSEKYVGFWLAYTLPTVFFFICPIVLFLGRHRYKQSPPQGSIVVEALRVWRTAMKGTVVWSSPVQTWRNWTHPDFWENAKPSRILKSQPEGGRPSWLTYDDIFVDEVRRGLKACQVFLFFPCYWICYNPLNSTLTSQAATMTTNGVPNDVINNLDPLALIIFIPICDYVIYPWFARMGIRFTPIKRIFFGFMTAVAAMVWAAVVQYYIYQTSPCGYQANSCDTPSHLNVWIQSGSYILIAFSEIFASITGLEYAFTKAPKNMRSVVMSVFLFMTAISSAITEALNPLAADPHLIWNYGSAAIIGFVSGIAFWICFRHLDKQEDKLNEITAMTGTGLKMVDERDSI